MKIVTDYSYKHFAVVEIYQIYYDAITKNAVPPGFIPLNNSKNERPDWFEFWVILNFLRSNNLKNDTWYGFLSPKFHLKTGWTPNDVEQLLQHAQKSDALLLSPGWDQLSYFLNPWEQGEVWHPGLLQESQKFLDQIGADLKLDTLVTDTTNSVFSNYVIAKKGFWEKWKEMAEVFFDYAEKGHLNNFSVKYHNERIQYPMKTFIQERFASLILLNNDIRTIAPDLSFVSGINKELFSDDIQTRHLLATCDLMKRKFNQNHDDRYLDMYWMIRRDIKYIRPH